ncbi:hypothetical protein [Halorubellus sp. PRR65]|jgi:hypothetical protein|uniref:hypothetical protein n=1 Tax=Halorubellus sp. PRR65 TaxID=3098148 RepID=UPI002B261D9B|nr:hypothetical protein [Halorubellus sp. PRR65]
MVPTPSTPSRRALLAGIGAGLATALAGCSASEPHQSPPEDGTLVTDYVAAKTHSPTDRPVVAPRDDEAVGGEATTTADPLSFHVIESESAAEALEFAEDATGVAAVRRLVAETAYSDESVLLYQTRIGECYRFQLNYVAKDIDGDPRIDFCRVVRDATFDCERDARDYVAAFVRLPFPADEYSGFSVSSGGSCDPIPDRYQNESESA